MKKKTAILQWAALLAAFLVVIIFVLFDSSKKVMGTAENTVKSHMMVVVEGYRQRIYARIQNVLTSGKTAAYLLEGSGKDNGVQYLKAICETAGVSTAIYFEEGTASVDQDGKQRDLSGKPYFALVTQELEDPRIDCVEDEELAQEKLLLIQIPVQGDEGRILIYYPAGEWSEMIDTSSGAGRFGQFALMDEEGMIIACTDSQSPFFMGGRFWENIAEKSSAEVSKIQKKMKVLDSGRAELSAGGLDGVMFYMPLGIETWYFIANFDQGYLERQEKLMWDDANKMIYQVTGIMALFIVLFMVVNLIGKIRNEGNSRALEEKADTDQLTGLCNKIATERRIREYMLENPDSLAMMFLLDIDNFKKINDTMGHAFGDEVLRTLGKHIGANFRVTDIIGRTGGDEFTIFLKSLKDDSNTLSEAQKLIEFFKDFEAGEYVKYSATASIGAAIFPADGKDFETLYKAADQALYKAKERGKNQLAFYDDRDRK